MHTRVRGTSMLIGARGILLIGVRGMLIEVRGVNLPPVEAYN